MNASASQAVASPLAVDRPIGPIHVRIALARSFHDWAGGSAARREDAQKLLLEVCGELAASVAATLPDRRDIQQQLEAASIALSKPLSHGEWKQTVRTVREAADLVEPAGRRRGFWETLAPIGGALAPLGGVVRAIQGWLASPALRAIQLIVVILIVALAAFWTYILFRYPYFNTRTADLMVIQRALSEYYTDNGNYPKTFEGDAAKFIGIGWDSEDVNWLPGLVPEYLPALPIDPRKSKIPQAQYVYASNGTSYKLVALQPEDCKVMVILRPWLRDPVRSSLSGNCVGYGVYTAGAEKF